MSVLKGAFIETGRTPFGGPPNVIVFQFNPDRVTRAPSLVRAPARPDGAGRRPANQQPDEPSESVTFTLRIDASDQRAAGSTIAAASGILPTLSALERLMLSRKSPSAELARLSPGKRRAHRHPPDQLPTVLFFWGPFRILPVSITSLSVAETEYDQLLNPVRAEVSVNLDVLTPSQLGDAKVAVAAYRYSQRVKDIMAGQSLVNAAPLGVSARLSLLL